jgi:hypothetical protein
LQLIKSGNREKAKEETYKNTAKLSEKHIVQWFIIFANQTGNSFMNGMPSANNPITTETKDLKKP